MSLTQSAYTKKSNVDLSARSFILGHHKEKSYRRTPLIVTLYEGVITDIDIKRLIEVGLQLVRFRMTHVSLGDKLKLLTMLKIAQKWVCEKYEVSSWPVATCIDIANAAIRTGYFAKELGVKSLYLEKGKTITITSEGCLWDRMDSETIFIDDPYTIQGIKPGCEITLCGGGVKLICRNVLSKKRIKCECIKAGDLINNEFVTMRGVKYKRPILLKFDLDLLALAMELKADVVTVFAVRTPTVLRKLRQICEKENYNPLFISIICEEEGLNNIDDILAVSDGIILAREYLTHQLVNRYALPVIQMQINAKCKQIGKPFFISGNILEQTLSHGTISSCDLADITNGVLQGCGFVLRHYSNADHLLKAMNILDDVCKSVESTRRQSSFWRIIDEYRMPIDAAEACVIACGLLIKQTKSLVVVLPTVSGRTAVELTRMAPCAVIITVSKREAVSRRLQLFRGICAITYDKPSKKDWYQEMEARIQFAVKFGIQRDILTYGNTYVTLNKSGPTSSFPDNLSIWTVTSKELSKYKIECDDGEIPKKPPLSNLDMTHVIE